MSYHPKRTDAPLKTALQPASSLRDVTLNEGSITQSSECETQVEGPTKRLAVTPSAVSRTQITSRRRASISTKGPLLTPLAKSEIEPVKSEPNPEEPSDVSTFSSMSTVSNVSTTATTNTMMGERGGVWANKPELLLCLVAYVIGYANVWRFPYFLLKYSGIFLIPYLFFQVLLGFPLVYMELALGQFSNFNAPRVFDNLVPVFRGVGWAMVIANALHQPYYNLVTAWFAYYFFNAFGMSWKSCRNEWNTENCTSIFDDKNCSNHFNKNYFYSHSAGACINDTATRAAQVGNLGRSTSSYEFFYYHMYSSHSTADGVGNLQWKLTLCLLLSWLLTLICVMRSIRLFGIIVYFTTALPLLTLLILLIYGVTLHDADKGFHLLVYPMWDQLSNPRLWLDAGLLVLFTNGIAIGVLITLSSFNKFKNNCFWDALFVVAVNISVSLVSSFAILSVIGSVAGHYNVSATTVANLGPNVAFVIYGQGLSQGQFGVVFSVLFFLMLVCVGLDTVFIKLESIVSTLCDQWPLLIRRRWLVATVICTLFFLIGVPMCTERGFLVFNIFKQYSFTHSIAYLSLLEVICVMHLFGYKKFFSNIRLMIGTSESTLLKSIGPTGHLMAVMLGLVVPALLLFLIGFTIAYGNAKRTKKEGRFDIYIPDWSRLFGWFMVFLPATIVLVFGAARLTKQFKEQKSIVPLFKATEYWCPSRKRKAMVDESFAKKLKKRALLDTPATEAVIKRY